MKIGLYTWGSEGDVRPFLALALGLSRAGHEVSLAYVAADARDWSGLAEPLGLRARAVAREPIAKAREALGDRLAALGGEGNALQQVSDVLRHLLDPATDDMWTDAQATVPGCDVVVAHLLYQPAIARAIAAGLPVVTVQPAPVIPTRHMPPMGAPDLGFLNRVTWRIAEVAGRRWFLPRTNEVRARAGLAPMREMFPETSTEIALGLTCVSPTLVPRPDDWSAQQRIPGFFDLPASEQGWREPEDLGAFLGAGDAPVLMSLGSMLTVASDDTRFCVRTMIEAADLSGRRALIQAPWAELPDLPTSPNVFRLGRAPHALVLARCIAMVHHGGAGTTHTACLAGKPSVVIPFLGDQFFWASRLQTLGIAPAPLPRKKLDAAGLAKRIRAITADVDARERARTIGEAMAREDGVGQAVKWIEAVGAR
jgi:sterol 3beta-glucosyltransferase